MPEKANHWTEATWKAKLADFLRFVDDGFSVCCVNFDNSYGFTVNGKTFRVKHAIQVQNIFRHLVRRAQAIGMKVNASKTSILCVSDALAYEADAFIEDEDLQRLGCQDSLKALGMVFGKRPNFDL